MLLETIILKNLNYKSKIIRFLTMSSVKKYPRPIIIYGPSGSGKSTMVNRLMKDFPDKFGFSISHTTRKARSGEKDGEHYHFTTKEQMQEEINDNKFLETAIFGGNIYGTSKASVDAITKSGKICILDIDTQGVKQIRKTDLEPCLIFIEPPSLEVQEARLRARNTESEQTIALRLKIAKEELIYGQTPGNFHIKITNDDLEQAYTELKKFIFEYLHSS